MLWYEENCLRVELFLVFKYSALLRLIRELTTSFDLCVFGCCLVQLEKTPEFEENKMMTK